MPGLTGVFRFDPLLNDGKARRVFGLEFPAADPAGRYDRVHLALEMLAAHPGNRRARLPQAGRALCRECRRTTRWWHNLAQVLPRERRRHAPGDAGDGG